MRVLRVRALTHVVFTLIFIVLFLIIFTPSLLFLYLHHQHHHHRYNNHHYHHQPQLKRQQQQPDSSGNDNSRRAVQVYRGGLLPQTNLLPAAPAAARQPPTTDVLGRRHQPDSACTAARNDTNRYLLTILPRGRLGNQMFQFASLLGIADANNRTPVVTTSCKVTHYFKASNVDVISDIRRFPGGGCSWRTVGEKSYAAKDDVFDDLPEENLGLKGFLQSWKYFRSPRASRKVREAFRFLDDVQKVVDSFDRNHTSDLAGDVIRVGVHVRRGDMTHRIEQRQGYLPASVSYLHKAMRHMEQRLLGEGDISHNAGKRVVFFVVSDDPDWCRENLLNVTADMNSTPSNVTGALNILNRDNNNYVIQTLTSDRIREHHTQTTDSIKYHTEKAPSENWNENIHKPTGKTLSEYPNDNFHNSTRKPLSENRNNFPNSTLKANLQNRKNSFHDSTVKASVQNRKNIFHNVAPNINSGNQSDHFHNATWKITSENDKVNFSQSVSKRTLENGNKSFEKPIHKRLSENRNVGETVRVSLRPKRSTGSKTPSRAATPTQRGTNLGSRTIRIVDKAPSVVHLGFLAACDHVIMTVGTFGWWGAYLSAGHVTYYAGYPREGSDLSEGFAKQDFYLPHWVAIGD